MHLCQTAVPRSRVASTSTCLMCLTVELRASKVEPPRCCRLVHLNFFKCYWLPEFPPSDRPVETSTCQRCQMQADIGHGPAGIGFLPLDTIFWSSWQRLISGNWLQSLHHGRNTTPPCHEVASFCCVKLAEMTMEINVRELTVLFEHCILEIERMETQGNFLRFWYRKWVQKLFCHQICYFLGGKFAYAGTYWKGNV
jgi:hypothetical protein